MTEINIHNIKKLVKVLFLPTLIIVILALIAIQFSPMPKRNLICNQYNKNDLIRYAKDSVQWTGVDAYPFAAHDSGMFRWDKEINGGDIYCKCNRIIFEYMDEIAVIAIENNLNTALEYIDDNYDNLVKLSCFTRIKLLIQSNHIPLKQNVPYQD